MVLALRGVINPVRHLAVKGGEKGANNDKEMTT
jgi:hypothetical protein